MSEVWDKFERLLPWLMMFGFLAYQDHRRQEDTTEIRKQLTYVVSNSAAVTEMSMDMSTIKSLMMQQGYVLPPMEGLR
jgi:hypothetical protein|tara:strand:- start:1441 stop:1674 length:234 start_codon:yes stop_codon:yes gene_type:complete